MKDSTIKRIDRKIDAGQLLSASEVKRLLGVEPRNRELEAIIPKIQQENKVLKEVNAELVRQDKAKTARIEELSIHLADAQKKLDAVRKAVR